MSVVVLCCAWGGRWYAVIGAVCGCRVGCRAHRAGYLARQSFRERLGFLNSQDGTVRKVRCNDVLGGSVVYSLRDVVLTWPDPSTRAWAAAADSLPRPPAVLPRQRWRGGAHPGGLEGHACPAPVRKPHQGLVIPLQLASLEDIYNLSFILVLSRRVSCSCVAFARRLSTSLTARLPTRRLPRCGGSCICWIRAMPILPRSWTCSS